MDRCHNPCSRPSPCIGFCPIPRCSGLSKDKTKNKSCLNYYAIGVDGAVGTAKDSIRCRLRHLMKLAQWRRWGGTGKSASFVQLTDCWQKLICISRFPADASRCKVLGKPARFEKAIHRTRRRSMDGQASLRHSYGLCSGGPRIETAFSGHKKIVDIVGRRPTMGT
jgi:hypothetical protein